MSFSGLKISLVLFAGLVLCTGSALAQTYQYGSDDGGFVFSASAGVLALEGREQVFTSSGSTNNLSLLIWQSVSPMVSARAQGTFGGGWTLTAEGRVAAGGFSYMEDYDWIAPWAPSFAFDDWSHRSQHSNTRLDWFAEGSVAVGYDFDLRGGMKANVNGGFAYTDVQWAASGGTGLYSTGGFRNDPRVFPNSLGIIYRQQLPSTFIGIDTSIEHGDLTVDLGARGGVAFMQQATDRHFQRVPPLLFENPLVPAPTLGASAKLTYALNDRLGVFVDARIDKMFLARGPQIVSNMNTGAPVSFASDAMGAELLSGSLSAGLKGSFN